MNQLMALHGKEYFVFLYKHNYLLTTLNREVVVFFVGGGGGGAGVLMPHRQLCLFVDGQLHQLAILDAELLPSRNEELS